MTRSTDQKIIAVEKIICYLQFPAHHAKWRQTRKHQSQSAGRGNKENMWTKKTHIVVSVGRNARGRASRLGRFRIG